MEIKGYSLPDPYVIVQDVCVHCENINRAFVRLSEPTYEPFYRMKCGWCGNNPRGRGLRKAKKTHKGET